MLIKTNDYDELHGTFELEFPEKYNIGVDICDKWYCQDPEKLAIIQKHEDGSIQNFSFGDLYRGANAIANILVEDGFQQQDAVSILLPQAPEVAFGHIAVYKAGGIAVPLFALFGIEALLFRLGNSETKYVITNVEGAEKINKIRDQLPDLRKVYCIDGEGEGYENIYDRIPKDKSDKRNEFEPVDTLSETPALIIYTSGTTGQPKGVLHKHAVLLGHLPGVEMSHSFFPEEGDIIWTPADWAWIGGLYDVLIPALHHGVPVVCCRFKKFTPEAAFSLIEELKIRNMFLPPTALKMLATVENPQDRWDMNVRSIASGGESLGPSIQEWGRKTFGIQMNEFYGQTECNMIVAACSAIMETPDGYMGKAAPGHTIKIIDDDGNVLPPNTQGNIAVYNDSPSKFINYWKNPKATEEKYIGNWIVTGDCGEINEDNFIKFVGRDDDVITSSGYRIGPGEIEDCIIQHESVNMVAGIGKPDENRTESVKAFVKLNEGFERSDALKEDIALYVKDKLSPHEYPREIDFIDEFPMTTTGKIQRKQLPRD